NDEFRRGGIILDHQNTIRHLRSPHHTAGATRHGFPASNVALSCPRKRAQMRHFGCCLTDLPGSRQSHARRTREATEMKPQLILLGMLATLSLTATALAGAAPAHATAAVSAVRTPMTPQQTHNLWQTAQTKLKATHLYSGPINGQRTD